jgi:uncharacterized protein
MSATDSISATIATELSVHPAQVAAAVCLLDGGATVPFVARYRKEATGGLDDTQLRTLEERLRYLRELEERRAVVLKSIEAAGKLSPELREAILAADSKTRLEDLYLPYRPKRRTKAQAAREAGLEPLLDALLADPCQDPLAVAARFASAERGIADAAAALDGAAHILAERLAEDADLVQELREHLWRSASLRSQAVRGKESEAVKFRDYFDAAEPLARVPSHRALAVFRGKSQGFLRLRLLVDGEPAADSRMLGVFCGIVAKRHGIADRGRRADAWLLESARLAWRERICDRIESELLSRLRERAEAEALRVFGSNLRDLLLAAPAGGRPVLGLDPGLRTGVKAAVVDATGKVLETATVYPHEPQRQWARALEVLADLAARHRVELIGVGNGTASRETDRLAAELAKRRPDLGIAKALVSEAGASVYSASPLAAEELPELDVTLRGAVSIARRLQDPLAELVKIDPKSIGVGQYQHDVDQSALARVLDAVVEDCVNAVGVEVNTASPALLERVSGLGPGLARSIVSYRDKNGAFRRRDDLKKVPRLGAKAFQQAAGFLRIRGGDDPLDCSAVHPEARAVVERILARTQRPLSALIGDRAALGALKPADFADEQFGVPTVADILLELKKPGRDPRPEFRGAVFREGVETIADLQPGMLLEGVVTNVTSFGAFVDIGVHRDGLVHISRLADRFVRDPRDVVKAGQVVRVKVLEVDGAAERISLTMKLEDPTPRV